eukprot:gene3550-6162_t
MYYKDKDRHPPPHDEQQQPPPVSRSVWSIFPAPLNSLLASGR